MDLYFYTFAKVPSVVEEGEFISASSLPVETPIFAFTKVVYDHNTVRVYENGGKSENIIFTGTLEGLESIVRDELIPLIKASVGEIPKGCESLLSDIVSIQEDADYDFDQLNQQSEWTIGQDFIACPADASGKLIVSVTPYYSAEVASPSDVGCRPPNLINADQSICEDHMLVAVFNESLAGSVGLGLDVNASTSTITFLSAAAQSAPIMGDLVKAENIDEVIIIARGAGFTLNEQELLALVMQHPGNCEIAPDFMRSIPMERDVWLSSWKNLISDYVNDLSLKFRFKIWIDDRAGEDGVRRLGMCIGGPLTT